MPACPTTHLFIKYHNKTIAQRELLSTYLYTRSGQVRYNAADTVGPNSVNSQAERPAICPSRSTNSKGKHNKRPLGPHNKLQQGRERET
jgi:hypothetical protein